MHQSTLQLTFGSQELIGLTDTIAAEPDFVRTPAAPQVAQPLRASAARLFGGGNVTHSIGWSIWREFETIAAARVYEFTRFGTLPEGANDLVVTTGGKVMTLIDAHLTNFRLTHQRGGTAIIIETVSAIGGALTVEDAE